MRIKHFLYNAFLVEEGKTRIAIDPGKNLWIFKLNSLIPKADSSSVTHIFVTHGDIDHYDYAASIAKETGAEVFCGEELVEDFLAHNINNVHKMGVGEIVDLDGIKVEGLKTEHGPLPVTLLAGLFKMRNFVHESPQSNTEVFLGPIKLFRKIESIPAHNHGTIKLLWGLLRLEKDGVPFARGSIGFKITIGDKSVVNLGDTVLRKEWEDLRPDVLMIPIGGREISNTMDEKEALEAVRLIKPKVVIPCHYNCNFLWKRKMNPADDKMFKREVEKLGFVCHIMHYGDEIEV